MRDALIDFGTGAITGGLTLSACWGLFWLVIGTIGLLRGTCGRRVVLNSLTVGLVPLLLVCVLFWMRGAAPLSGAAFAVGLSLMPVMLMGFGLRPVPDGRRAGSHMLEGVRQLMDELLGKHHECGGCGHDHEPRETEGCR
ncbi:MAG TPA: hypothetical protein VFP04_06490 [Nitrospira sp.]|nr:hypothetical protein [Nitrospira sp.]